MPISPDRPRRLAAVFVRLLVLATTVAGARAQVRVAMLADLVPGPGSSSPDWFTQLGERALFTSSGNDDLWATDGTAAGTQLVQAGIGRIGEPVLFRGRAFFGGGTRMPQGRELWESDGTAAGTRLFADLAPGGAASDPQELTHWAGALWFTADSGGAHRLFRSDGTPAGTVAVPVSGTRVTWLTPLGDRLLCILTQGGNKELVAFDGTTLHRLGDLAWPTRLVPHRGRVYFARWTTVERDELWSTDGTPGGTGLVADIVVGGGSDPRGLTSAGDLLFFTADDRSGHGRELWATDGTTAGTRMVLDLRPGPDSGVLATDDALAAAGETIVFAGITPATGLEPWCSDGTAVGTTLLLDLTPGTAHSDLAGFARVGTGQVWFTQRIDNGTFPLAYAWRTDGTPGRTVCDAPPTGPRRLGIPRHVATVRGRLLTIGEDATLGYEPFALDGLALATTLDAACSTGRATLASGDPVLGSTLHLWGEGAPPGGVAGLFLGPPLDPAVPFAGCDLHVDLRSAVALPPLATGSGSWRLAMPLPAFPRLRGTTLVLQGAFAGRGAGAVTLGNALRLVLGS